LKDERPNACFLEAGEHVYIYVEPAREPSMELLFTGAQIEDARKLARARWDKLPPRPALFAPPRSFWETWWARLLL
jgi:hypothetical protein